jgi:hypothetical protein
MTFKATAHALDANGKEMASVTVEGEDERFAAFQAVEQLNDHPAGVYWSRIVIEID